jgi:putative transposase
VFVSLSEARQIIEAWRHDYNHVRPHSSLGALTPIEFAHQQGAGQAGEKGAGSASLTWADGPHAVKEFPAPAFVGADNRRGEGAQADAGFGGYEAARSTRLVEELKLDEFVYSACVSNQRITHFFNT